MKNRPILWLSLLGIAILAVLLAACSGGSQNSGEGSGNSTTINVEAIDFSFSLDASQAEAGTITFVVQNNGSMHHDFAIRGNGMEEKTPTIDSGGSATLTVDLEPGTYTYVCTIPGHEQLGMSGTFTVTQTD
jgi:plastocyanin